MNNKFKILKSNWFYVDVNMLGKGVYQTMLPQLFEADYTKAKLLETHKNMQKYTGVSDEYIKAVEENLKQCELVDIHLTESQAVVNVLN